ncbi:hypothetical protein J6590_050928 [Homalodisca vitripennis]|nr:hypothetical protein J6590_050928 [Homalodisca vitripennis]
MNRLVSADALLQKILNGKVDCPDLLQLVQHRTNYTANSPKSDNLDRFLDFGTPSCSEGGSGVREALLLQICNWVNGFTINSRSRHLSKT